MAYDRPYRLEYFVNRRTDRDTYAIMRTGEGIICEGENFDEMRKLVDCANEATMQMLGDRGR